MSAAVAVPERMNAQEFEVPGGRHDQGMDHGQFHQGRGVHSAAEQLIRENFLTQPVIMVDLILALGEAGQHSLRSSDMNLRQQSLATQNILLRVLEGKKSALPEAVNVLVMNWLGEAEQTYRAGGAVNQTVMDYDNMYLYRSGVPSAARPRTSAAV